MATIALTQPRTGKRVKSNPFQMGAVKAGLLALPFMLLSVLLLLGGPTPPSDWRILTGVIVAWVFLNASFFLMLYTGKTDRYRAVLFIVTALCFIVSFMTNLLEIRGSNVLTEENAISGETPFCHIVIPMVLLPAALTRTIIFPGSMITGFASVASMLVLWIGVTLAIGKGWCSWVCFYGGLDEGFSRILRKPVIKKIDAMWRYLPYAVLVTIVLISALTLSPTYCEWLCPYKAVTEYGAVNTPVAVLQTIIFVSLFIGLVVLLPILTKKRTQCGLFCPFGAMQSFTNKISAFDVKIDTENCPECKKCIQVCPTYSLDENSLKTGRTLMSCTKCGKCIDACPKNAITYHIKGTAGSKPRLARALYLYPAFIMLAAIGGSMITGAIYRILMLITTGSMI